MEETLKRETDKWLKENANSECQHFHLICREGFCEEINNRPGRDEEHGWVLGEGGIEKYVFPRPESCDFCERAIVEALNDGYMNYLTSIYLLGVPLTVLANKIGVTWKTLKKVIFERQHPRREVRKKVARYVGGSKWLK